MPERIQVQLSVYEKVQILRDQLEERQEELAEVERTIRTKLQEIEKQRFLEGLSPYYAMHTEGLPSPDEIEELEKQRSLLVDLIATIEQQIPALLGSAGEEPRAAQQGAAPAGSEPPQTPPPPGGGAARKAKFDF